MAELQALTRAHALHEPFWALLVRVLHRTGRRADALAAYREAANLPARELDATPGPELRAAQEMVLQEDHSESTTLVPRIRAAQAIGDVEGQVRLRRSLGSHHLAMREFPEAIRELEEALTLVVSTGDRSGEAFTRWGLGATFCEAGDQGKALYRARRSLALYTELGDSEKRAIVLSLVGVVSMGVGDRAGFHPPAGARRRTVHRSGRRVPTPGRCGAAGRGEDHPRGALGPNRARALSRRHVLPGLSRSSPETRSTRWTRLDRCWSHAGCRWNGCRTTRRSASRCTAACWPTAGCFWCWTPLGTPITCVLCCPAHLRVLSWSPVGTSQ